MNATLEALLLRHPRAISSIGRLLTSRVVADLVADAWSLYWNDLVDGARPGRGLRLARVAGSTARTLTAASRRRRALESVLR